MQLSSDMHLLNGALGGTLLALSSSAFLLLTGRMSGMSGILDGVLRAQEDGVFSWRWSYIGGLGAAGFLLARSPDTLGSPAAATLVPWASIAAGILVGYGTRLGGGCTSGHGICGLPRLSVRSLVAVGTFMATGAATAILAGTDAGRSALLVKAAGAAPSALAIFGPTLAALGVSAVIFSKNWFGPKPTTVKPTTVSMHLVSLASGLLFGLGLGLSGMTDNAKVSSFLNPWAPGGWDPSLAAVMGAGVVVNYFTFNAISRLGGGPPLAETTTYAACAQTGSCAANNKIDTPLVIGCAMFGVGWGLSGVCPGPAMVGLAGGRPDLILFVPAMIGGMVLKGGSEL
jgi:uncharacterized membrane protein YedE/YeeE